MTDTTADTLAEALAEALARHRYQRFDSHFSMPGGFSWEAYKVEDPQGADFYLNDAADDVAALTPVVAAQVEAARARLAEERERWDNDVWDFVVEWGETPEFLVALRKHINTARIARAGGTPTTDTHTCTCTSDRRPRHRGRPMIRAWWHRLRAFLDLPHADWWRRR